jgi:hypothetical protein
MAFYIQLVYRKSYRNIGFQEKRTKIIESSRN